MARPLKKQHVITPPARVVLNWLAHQPARVYDFSEVAAAVRLKRPVAQRAILELRHPRCGSLLKDKGPDGLRLRQRHAYLPKDSEARVGIPQPEHPEEEAREHPTVTALRRATAERVEREQAEESQRAEEMAVRGRVVRKEKLRRKLALAKQRQADGTERDEAISQVPTLEEVIEAGYSPATAAGIVAEQQALADGKSPVEAEALGAAAFNESKAKEDSVTASDGLPEGAYLTEDEIGRALGGPDDALVNGHEDTDDDAGVDPDDGEVNGHAGEQPIRDPDLAPRDSGLVNFEPEEPDDADVDADLGLEPVAQQAPTESQAPVAPEKTKAERRRERREAKKGE